MTLPRHRLAVAALLGLGMAAACVDESFVFENRDLFENPLPAALGFLGYTSVADTLTVCGNCHIGAQSVWQESGHAGAWDVLQANPGAQAFCEACHTVNELGNAVTEPAGHNATGEERYQDVQCESCHGPGLEHATDPNKGTIPLAYLNVDTLTGCGECHQGDHHPFVNEWAESGHAVVGFAADRDGCRDCHSGGGALAQLGTGANWIEKDSMTVAITCAVCHDPHGSDQDAQLRLPIHEPSVDVNLCMQCHQRGATPSPEGSNRPHSPEGPTLLGTAGWFPPGLQSPIQSTHGSNVENPGLCAGCHVESYTVTDAVTGDFLFNATGHRFESTPCVDAQGIPVAGPCDADSKTYVSCTECHTEQVAKDLIDQANASVDPLVAELESLLAQVDPAEFDPDDGVLTPAEGAQFNLDLAAVNGSVVHNVFLIRGLLTASIDEVRSHYGLP